MTSSPQHSGPAHGRLETMSVKHLNNLFRKLCAVTGQPSWDTGRDERTNTKAKLVDYIRATWTGEQIDSAHKAVCSQYHSYSGKPASGSNPAIVVDDVPVTAPAISGVTGEYIPVSGGQSSGGQSSGGQSSGSQSSGGQSSGGQSNSGQSNSGQSNSGQSNSGQSNSGQSNSIPEPELPQDALSQAIAAIARKVLAHEVDKAKASTAGLAEQIKRAIETIKPQQTAASGGDWVGQPTLVHVQQGDLPPVNVGIQHRQFPKLLQMCSAKLRDNTRLNIWLYGPAGTGKTTAARKVAEVLNLPFRYNGALDTRYELVGFVDANGRTVRTAFRDAWEHGGIYLFDEIDASMPGALLALNGALANGVAAFPDGMIERHPDCVIIAGANTTGMGGTIEYVGRYKQDAALTDRFVFLDWPLDEALEAALCGNAPWLKYVRTSRQRLAASGIRGHNITPRATLYGEALLSVGMDLDDVRAATLRKGLSPDNWSQIL